MRFRNFYFQILHHIIYVIFQLCLIKINIKLKLSNVLFLKYFIYKSNITRINVINQKLKSQNYILLKILNTSCLNYNILLEKLY